MRSWKQGYAMNREDCADLCGIVDHKTIVCLARLVQSLSWPTYKDLNAWICAPPHPGDLVVEMSNMRDDLDRVGSGSAAAGTARRPTCAELR